MKKWPIKIEPSILAADFGHIAAEVKKIEQAGADAIHIDIMDGHFVPNLSMGPAMVAAINRQTKLFLDVHLMMYNPYDYIEKFVEAGADRITFHYEATEDVEETINFIRKCNVQAGLAFCPDTGQELVMKYLDKCDLILLMTVNPGFGGQAFMPEVLEKIKYTSQMRGDLPCEIQVDGGINDKTAPLCIEAGANNIVAGTYLFKAPDMKTAIQGLRK